MMQEIFRLPFIDLPIYGYGVMMVIGFLGGIQLAKFLAKRSGIDPEIFVNAGLIALVTGVVGARLSHVIENIHQYTDPRRSVWANLFDAINIRTGGLTYYGGFLLAFASLTFYAIRKKLPLRLAMDIVAPCLMIGLGFGRIGCLLNGCCYGAECDVPWAITFPYDSIAYRDEVDRGEIKPPEQLINEETGRPINKRDVAASPSKSELAASEHSLRLHPAQLYSAFTAFLIAALSLAFFTIPHAPGRGFALMLIAEGTTRFLLELLRVEPPVVHIAGYGWSLSMVLGAGMTLLGLILWLAFTRPTGERGTLMPTASAA
jgi:phosphatidylglycerol---prolipoprotein diacylglyceryl transferase